MNEADIKTELNKIQYNLYSKKKFEKIIDRLFELDYDGILTDSNGITPIIHAVKYHHKDLIEHVLGKFKDIDIKDNIFSKPIHIEKCVGSSLFDATSCANSKLIKIVNTCDLSGNSALFYAVDTKSFDIACMLLLHGADISCLDIEKQKELFLYSVGELLDVHYMEQHKLSPIVGLLAVKVPEALKDYDNDDDLNDYDQTYSILLRRFLLYGHTKVVASLIDSVQDQDDRKFILNEVYEGTSLLDLANSCFSKLCDYDHLQIIKYLFEQGATNTCNNVDPVYRTLSSSAEKGHLETFKYLVKKAKKEDFNTYIGLALIEYHINIIEYIWNNYREYTVDRSKNTALHYATWRGTLESVKYLCENGANADINSSNCKGETPLDNAIEGNRTEIIKYLISEYDARPGSSSYKQAAYENIKQLLRSKNHNDFGNLLQEAVVASDLSLLENLITQGANINHINESGMNPLHLAVQNIDSDATTFLLQHGAVYDIPTKNNKTALSLSTFHNKLILGIVDKLFKSTNLIKELKKVINMLTSYDDAYDPGNPMVYLINVKNHNGQTLLHKAVVLNDKDATDLLIKYDKCYIGIKKMGILPTVRYYIPMNIALKDSEGNTPLHLAAKNGNIEIASSLINENPNSINIKNNDGHTPLNVAGRHKHKNFVEFLLEKVGEQSP